MFASVFDNPSMDAQIGWKSMSDSFCCHAVLVLVLITRSRFSDTFCLLLTGSERGGGHANHTPFPGRYIHYAKSHTRQVWDQI